MPRVDTSVPTLKSSATWETAAENTLDANVVVIVVNPYKMVVMTFFFASQFVGLVQSSASHTRIRRIVHLPIRIVGPLKGDNDILSRLLVS